MFEKRPIWGIIVGLNVCILIWLISVQESVMFDASTAALSSSSGSSSNFIITNAVSAGMTAAGAGSPQLNNGASRDLLAKHMNVQSNEYVDETNAAASTLTTFNLSSSSSRSPSHNQHLNISHNFKTDTSKNLSPFTNLNDAIKTTTKTSDLSEDLLTLTSSLGTGLLDFKTRPTPSWATLTAVASALPDEDFNQLIDLHNFHFLMPQPVCGNHIEALILIHSAPKNNEKRQVIRETWGSISHHRAESPLKVLFLLGAVESRELQEDLEHENNEYRDMIQGSFIDDYRNMTYKHIMAFKWFLYNCPQAQILIKVDDDVYVNTPQLIKYLKKQQLQQQQNQNITNNKPTIALTEQTPNDKTSTTTTNTNSSSSNNTTTTTTSTASSFFHKFNIFASDPPSSSSESNETPNFNASHDLFNHPQNLLFCQKIIGSLVKRSYRSKWRVSFKEYSERYYPPYCPGYAIIYSPDIIFRLYTAAQSSKYFWIDDVHITGVLAQQTNTTITTSSHYVLYNDECDQLLTGKTDLSSTEFLFASHNISAQKIKLLWHLQMMSIQTLDDLHYNKVMSLNDLDNDDDNDVFIKKQQRRRPRRRRRQPGNDAVNENLFDNEISSSKSSSFTFSSNGFR